jgi:hypothetical protein
LLDEDYASLFAVTGPQIQAVAKKYLTATRRDVLVIQPAPPAPASKEAAPKGAAK